MSIYVALAEPNRRLILEQLALHGQMAVNDIAKQFQITGSAISQHLKVLLDAKLVKREKYAQKRVYSLNNEGFEELDEWMKYIKSTYEKRLDNLETFLNKSS